MSAARKILFSGPEGSANIDGLIESLRKTSPGMLARLEETGGRIHGEKVTKDFFDGSTNANSNRIMNQKEV